MVTLLMTYVTTITTNHLYFKAALQYYVCRFTNSNDMTRPQIKLKMAHGILTTIISVQFVIPRALSYLQNWWN